MVLLNMFLAILNDCYYEVKNVDNGEAFADAELGAFMADYAKQKVNNFKDETFELIEGTVDSLLRFLRNDKEKDNKDDLESLKNYKEKDDMDDSESLSDQAKLASLESIGDLDSDDDNDYKETDRLVRFKSLNSMDECESMSLTDLKESILQIGREMRQSLTPVKSVASKRSRYHHPVPYDFKRALARLEEDDETLNFHWHSSYFSASGSYLEDIWKKDRRSFQMWRRHKGAHRTYQNVRENENWL